MKSAGNKKILFFAMFYLTLIIQAQLHANDCDLNPKELSAFDVTFHTEKKQLPMEGLFTLDGANYNSAALRGKYVLVNLWASWCPDCRREKPSIERLYRELNTGRVFNKDELALLTVSLGEEPDTVKNYMSENQYGFPVVLDKEDKLRKTYAPWIPTSYILDPDGNIIARIIPKDEWDSEQLLGTLRRLVLATVAHQ